MRQKNESGHGPRYTYKELMILKEERRLEAALLKERLSGFFRAATTVGTAASAINLARKGRKRGIIGTAAATYSLISRLRNIAKR